VKIDGTAYFFCNSKCQSNKEIRNPRHVKWTDTYRNEKIKEKSAVKK
ncbi:MAG: 50S ribosomal protein L24, partial [Nanoarchaeota archaeon]|nr:50S ribosomal protein L24 [Nanoarchaeota archaeon]